MDMTQALDWAKRILWTALYVFVAAFLATAGGKDLTSTEVLKAVAIAAILVVAKSLVAGRFGDPNKIRTTLSEIGIRALHTFWQTFVAFAVATDLSPDSLKLAAIAAALNTLRGVALPTTIPGSDDTSFVAPVLQGEHEAPAPEPPGQHEAGATLPPVD